MPDAKWENGPTLGVIGTTNLKVNKKIMKNILLILMLLPTVLLANNTAELCNNQPPTIKCDNWILTGEARKTSEWECLVEEKICRQLNGCGKLTGTNIEKRLSSSCSILMEAPEPSAPAKNSCSPCKYNTYAKNYQQVCATWNESATKWDSIVTATCAL